MFIDVPVSGRAAALLLVISFVLTSQAVAAFSRFLPRDRGRALAYEGAESKGKYTSTGILFVSFVGVFCLLMLRLSLEVRLYILAMLFEMTMGFLDDNAKVPWSELKKGLLDLAGAAFVTIVYMRSNGTMVHLVTLGRSVVLPAPLFFALSMLLMLVSVNVTNITDGVDGLSSSVACTVLLGVLAAGERLHTGADLAPVLWVFLGALLCYLWFNAKPCTHLMGDAGSRAMGALIAIAFLKLGAPFLYIPMALVFILDGGSSLVKLSTRRYLKRRNFMQHITTPLHDHVRKRRRWSDEQTVTRFMICQALLCLLCVLAMK